MGKRLYQVQPGDTLRSIATAQQGDEDRWQEIAYHNSLSHPYFIRPGQILLLADDEPLEIVVTGGKEKQPGTKQRAPAGDGHETLSPANLIVLAGVAVVVWWMATR